ncbi:putative C6 transcription factor (Mut3) [Aspergillus tanneri]|uniref:Xylanolytic transcriptional activator regulatory domain-containing protein n=1 Tax=Aspergillus tanneri TaxID=1220188 RepID=A0A5M9MUY1_9EURO|nr:uncharacterized protein ATNIH1004_007734 [Aspergillus tanneri]KAA8646307.1 hypothetical protein ATNIH1004_007734 [Aspergillus tanneri]
MASPSNTNEDDPSSDLLLYAHDDSDPSAHLSNETPGAQDVASASAKEPLPMQSVAGPAPIAPSTVMPSNRRRNPAPQYVEALETRLHKAEALLRVVLPDINLDDPRFDVHATEQLLAAIKREKHQPPQQPEPQPPPPACNGLQPAATASGPADAAPTDGAGCEESLLESMVDSSGFLDLDDQGHWDYHGHTSGMIFIRRLRKQLGAADIGVPAMRSRPITQQMLDSPKSASESPQDASLPPTHDLPARDVARHLCHNALEDGCSLMRFVHEPSFYAMFDRIYDTPLEQYSNEEHSFLPLLYIVMSVGCLFSDDRAGTLDLSGYESAIGQGFQFFKAGRHLLDITDCRDLTSLQAICFMVLFLQSSAKLSTCYSYVGIALRSALRLGLHRRAVTANFNPLESELRRRIFWVVRKMDVYVSTLLGLPQMLSDDDIDQEYPASVDGEYIGRDGILPTPADYTPLMAGANAHTRLSNIILKVVKYIYPVKNAQHRSESDQRYVVSHSKIREIERDLQAWMEELPAALRPGTEVSPQLERIRQLLRISYAHVQVVMYRPFLHYVSSGSQARGVDRRSYACAAACVSVSRNIVHITTGMHKRGLLNGAFWFTMYTTYFAILSLLFFVLENPDSPTAKDGVLKDAMEGKNTLAGLAKKSMAADRCSQSLNSLFKNLPDLLKNRQSTANPTTRGHNPPPQRSNTFPLQLLTRPSKAEASNTPKSLDDSASHRRTPSNTGPIHTPTWFASTPESAPETVSTPSDTFPVTEPVGVSSNTVSTMPMSLPLRESPSSSALYAPNTFTNPTNLPDLMGIMFPSDDPFAYPTQPMSTLEDGHFRHEGAGPKFGLNPTSQRSAISAATSPDPSTTMGVSTPNLDSFAHFPLFPGGTPTPMIPNAVAGIARVEPGERGPVNSPDLVSLPNSNFMLQGYNFQPQNYVADVSTQPPAPSGQAPGLGIGLDEADSMGMGIDLGISLDDIFGNGDICRGGTLPNDEWAQWMNTS